MNALLRLTSGLIPLAAAIAFGAATPARAQQAEDIDKYPSKTVHIVVAFPAGSGNDLVARIAAQFLTDHFGRSFVVDNVVGGGGTLGAGQVARAAPDGYTLFAGSGATMTVNPFLIDNISYKPLTDFAPITTVSDGPMIVAVNANAPFRTIKDLADAAKAKPGELKYGSGGPGSAAHLAAEIFKWKTSSNLLHVPFRGVAMAMTDLQAGRIDAMFVSYPTVQSMAESGQARILAVAADKRSAIVPNVPTAVEQGLNGYVLSNWTGLLVPAKTPPAIVAKLHAALTKVLADPALVKRFADMGSYPIPSTPEEFTARITNELSEMEALLKVAKIKE